MSSSHHGKLWVPLTKPNYTLKLMFDIPSLLKVIQESTLYGDNTFYLIVLFSFVRLIVYIKCSCTLYGSLTHQKGLHQNFIEEVVSCHVKISWLFCFLPLNSSSVYVPSVFNHFEQLYLRRPWQRSDYSQISTETTNWKKEKPSLHPSYGKRNI